MTSPEEVYQESNSDSYNVFKNVVLEKEQVGGKTILQWKEYFKLDIPESPDPEICKNIDIQLIQLHHEATFLYNLTKLCLDRLHTMSEAKFQQKYKELYEGFRNQDSRPPGAPIIENLAKVDVQDVVNMRDAAKRELEFWKRIIANLDMQRRLINDATINNGIQVKMDMKYGGHHD